MNSNTIILFIAIIAFITLHSCGNNSNNKKPQAIDNTISEDRGQIIFKKHCVACHGVDGKLGLNGAANLAQSVLSKEETIKVITSGRKAMLSFRGILNDKEIESVSLYVLKMRE